jgi:hypothetical protein
MPLSEFLPRRAGRHNPMIFLGVVVAVLLIALAALPFFARSIASR